MSRRHTESVAIALITSKCIRRYLTSMGATAGEDLWHRFPNERVCGFGEAGDPPSEATAAER